MKNTHPASTPTSTSTPVRTVAAAAPKTEVQAERSSLDHLRAEHGGPSSVMRQIAFRGYSAERGLQQGQDTASDRILDGVGPFTRSAVSIWNAFTPEQRAQVIGYSPALLPVLLDEAATLRELNARYDAQAKRAQVSKVQRENAARLAFQEGRGLRDQAARAVKMYLGADALDSDGFERAVGTAVNAEKLAQGLDEFADYVDGFHVGLDADTLAAYEELGIGARLVAQLRTSAVAVRRTADELNDLDDQTRVTQRQLDMQDGRVLHMIGLIYGAFRGASRRDQVLLVPDLGELTPMFERDRRPSASPPPAPSPVPA